VQPGAQVCARNREPEAPAPATDKPFVDGGKIDFDLDGGAYEIKAASDSHIRVAVSGTTGNAKVDVGIEGNNATIKVKDTPHSNFRAIVEVPAKSDLVVRLTGGELTVDQIIGNKDVESYGGNVRVAVGDPSEYARVDAAVKAGEIKAQPFGGSKSGLSRSSRGRVVESIRCARILEPGTWCWEVSSAWLFPELVRRAAAGAFVALSVRRQMP